MVETLPLFPLGTVLLPGAWLPLHIFEARYRQLVTDLITETVPGRSFGVLATREGHEPGPEGSELLYTVGCRATLREARRLPDGRFDISTRGDARFRLLDVDHQSAPYLVGHVQPEPDRDPGDEQRALLPALARAAGNAHRDYSTAAGPDREPGDEPGAQTEPAALAYELAAGCLLTLADRQALLEQCDPAERLRMIRGLLLREAAFLRGLHAVPVSLSRLATERSAN